MCVKIIFIFFKSPLTGGDLEGLYLSVKVIFIAGIKVLGVLKA
jgi:hypothetical protein